MKKQTILLLFAFLLGVSSAQASTCYSGDGSGTIIPCVVTLTGYIQDTSTINYCYTQNNIYYCNMNLSLIVHWNGSLLLPSIFFNGIPGVTGDCVPLGFNPLQSSCQQEIFGDNENVNFAFPQDYIAWQNSQQLGLSSEYTFEYYNNGGYIAFNTSGVINPFNAPISSLTNLAPPCPFSSCTSDPINIATGEDYFSSTDFSLNGRGPKLELFRRYRSYSTNSGMFGYGWRTDFDANLTTDSSGDVIIYDRDGTGSYFMNYSGTYAPSPGNYSTIAHNPDNTYTITNKNGVVTHYDINGRLSSRTDRNGNALTFVYNPSVSGGTYIQDASGRQIKLYFNSNNLVTSAVDPAGKTYQYGYDVNGNLASITDPTGAVTNYTYDPNHKITQFTNSNGHNRYYQYDSQGRAYSTSQSNNVNRVTLDFQANNTTVVTDSLGNKDTYVFNNAGLLNSHTDPLGNVTQQTWDINMNLLSRTDALNNVTNYIYDGKGNLTQITDPQNNQTNMYYSTNFNLITSKSDALGNITNFTYDAAGNLTGIADAMGGNHTFAYDGYGNVITATDSLGNSTHFTYDAIGHVLRKTNALGNSTNYSYE